MGHTVLGFGFGKGLVDGLNGEAEEGGCISFGNRPPAIAPERQGGTWRSEVLAHDLPVNADEFQ
jgi:hypothetical protein